MFDIQSGLEERTTEEVKGEKLLNEEKSLNNFIMFVMNVHEKRTKKTKQASVHDQN